MVVYPDGCQCFCGRHGSLPHLSYFILLALKQLQHNYRCVSAFGKLKMSLLAYVVSHDVLKNIYIDSILFVHFPSFLLMFFRYFRAPVESCDPPPEVDLEMQRREPLQQQLKNI